MIINFTVFIYDPKLFTQSDIYIIPQNAHFIVPWLRHLSHMILASARNLTHFETLTKLCKLNC